MFWDVIIAAGNGVTQLVITWYGVHISVKDGRVRNAFIIGIVGFFGIGLTIYGAIRSGMAQRTLQGQLDTIQKNTERPIPAPIVNVNPPSINFPVQEAFMTTIERHLAKFQIGDLIQVNYTNANMNQQVPASNVQIFGTLHVVEAKQIGMDKEWMVPASVQDKQYKQFLTDTAKARTNPRTFGPGQTSFATTYGPTLDDSLDRELRSGPKAILHTMKYEWNERGGRRINEVCEWLQPDSFQPNHQEIWHYCEKHNGITK